MNAREGGNGRVTLFSGVRPHDLIRDRHGRPGKISDKGTVEGLVCASRRNVRGARFATWETFNLGLEGQCRRRQADVLRGIAQRLARDVTAISDLPASPFDAILAAPGLSGIYIGPDELVLSYGHAPAFDRDEPELIDVIRHIGRRTSEVGLL